MDIRDDESPDSALLVDSGAPPHVTLDTKAVTMRSDPLSRPRTDFSFQGPNRQKGRDIVGDE